jgi:CcmD family protein
MAWLLAAYAAVVVAITLYALRLARMRRALEAEFDATKR